MYMYIHTAHKTLHHAPTTSFFTYSLQHNYTTSHTSLHHHYTQTHIITTPYTQAHIITTPLHTLKITTSHSPTQHNSTERQYNTTAHWNAIKELSLCPAMSLLRLQAISARMTHKQKLDLSLSLCFLFVDHSCVDC